MKTVETAIVLPIIIVIIVTMLNLIVGACKTSIRVNEKFSKNTKEWSESAPGKRWEGVSNGIK